MRNTDISFNVNESLCHLLILFDASLCIHQVVTDIFILWKADILVIECSVSFCSFESKLSPLSSSTIFLKTVLKYWMFSQWAFRACFPKDTCFRRSWRATDFYFITLFCRAVLLISVSGNEILSDMDTNRRIWTQIFGWQEDTWHCEIDCCLPGWVTGAEVQWDPRKNKK